MITIISNHQTYILKNTFIHYSFCVLLVDLSGILIGLRDPTTQNKQIQKQTINKNIYTIIHPHAREHITSNKKVGTRVQAGLSGSTAFAYRTTDNPGGAAMQGGY